MMMMSKEVSAMSAPFNSSSITWTAFQDKRSHNPFQQHDQDEKRDSGPCDRAPDIPRQLFAGQKRTVKNVESDRVKYDGGCQQRSHPGPARPQLHAKPSRILGNAVAERPVFLRDLEQVDEH